MFSAPWWLLDNTVIAAFLALIVALVCRVRRVPPVVRHALWLVVLIKLIAPPLFSGPIQIPLRWQSLAGRLSARDGELADRRSGILPLRDTDALQRQAFQRPVMRMQAFEPSRAQVALADKAMLSDARDAAGCRVYDDDDLRQAAERAEPAAALDNQISPVDATRVADSTDSGEWPSGVSANQRRDGQRVSFRENTLAASEQPECCRQTGPVPPHDARQISAATFLLAGFLAATCVMVGVQVVRLVRLKRLLRRDRPAPHDFSTLVEDLAATIGVRAPQVRFSADISSPLVCAFHRPILLWPVSQLASLRDNALRAVILHELAHLARRDHLVGWLELGAGCLWWWNPLFWYVKHQLRETAELACDAWVMALIPDGRRDYARALVDLAELDSRRCRAFPALGVAEGSKNLFERRLVMIMGTRVRHRLGVFGILGTGLLGLAALPGCTPGQASEEPVFVAEAVSATVEGEPGEDPFGDVAGVARTAPADLDPVALDSTELPAALGVEEPPNQDVPNSDFTPQHRSAWILQTGGPL